MSETEKFVTLWTNEIAKIEKRTLDSRSVFRIKSNFDIQHKTLMIYINKQESEESYLVLEGLESQLEIALETARCNYNLQNKGLTARIGESIAKTVYGIADILRSVLRR